MARDQQLGIRLPAQIKAALAKAAAEDHRSMSSLIEKVMAEWLVERGYIKKHPLGRSEKAR